MANDKDLIGKRFDYLTIVDTSKTGDEYICKCICGKTCMKTLKELLNKKCMKSCGCCVTERELVNLSKLWTKMSKDEQNIWGTWKDFVSWAKQLGYNEVFSYRKKNRKLPYNMKNLEFGLYINKKFFGIEQLKRNGYWYNISKNKFVTSVKMKNKTLDNDKITKILNSKNKHKTLPEELFKKLKK